MEIEPTKSLPSTNKLIVVIVVTGGDPIIHNSQREVIDNTATSVEAINADWTRLCVLPDLPTQRRHHTMSGSMVCGGRDTYAMRSCHKFQNGAWKLMPFSLLEKRRYHVSWTRSGGKSRLLGGYDNDGSSTTSELVSESGSIAGFPMKYKTE